MAMNTFSGSIIGSKVVAGDAAGVPTPLTINGQVERLIEEAFRMADRIRDLESSILGPRPPEVAGMVQGQAIQQSLSARLATLESALDLIGASLGRLCLEV